MEVWGCPRRIKLDNGLPLAAAGNQDIPTLSQLWWIGLGIEVKLNHPKTPQQNGMVEGLQGICFRWSNPKAYEDLESFQQRVNQSTYIQREVYRMRRHGYKTRRELFPELWQNLRRYDPGNFKMQNIYNELSSRVWQRTVNAGGNVKFWKAVFYIGNKFKHLKLNITYDPFEHKWLFRTQDGQLLQSSTRELFTEAEILKHAGISKNVA